MSEDIVELLRKNSSEFSLMWNASDTIEALRGENARLAAQVEALVKDLERSDNEAKVQNRLAQSAYRRVETAEAEAARLKAALDAIAVKAGTSVFAGAVAAGNLLDDIERMADKALAGETT